MKKVDHVIASPCPKHRAGIAALARQLTDEQAAEVERRMGEANPTFLTLEEVRKRFAIQRGRRVR